MQLKIIPFDNNYKTHKVERSLSDIFKIHPGLNPVFRLLKFCCLDNNEIVIIYNNPSSRYCLYYDHEIPEAIIYIIKNILNKKDIDLRMEYQLLLIAEVLDPGNDLVFKILEYIDWPSGKKGHDYFISFKGFSKLLKELIFKKSLSLSDAFFFHEYFIKDYDAFLKIIPDKLTFSERNNIIRNITEFAIKNKKSINDIIKTMKNLKNSKNRACILDYSNNLRYPERLKYRKYFISEVAKLELPKGANIHFDDTFEREDYSIQIKFNDFSSLLNKINLVKKSLENRYSENDFVDFFDHDRLFEDNEE